MVYGFEADNKGIDLKAFRLQAGGYIMYGLVHPQGPAKCTLRGQGARELYTCFAHYLTGKSENLCRKVSLTHWEHNDSHPSNAMSVF